MSKFPPSIYQQTVYDFIINGKGNAVVEAVAGSGKTTTLLNSINLIPRDKRVIFLAFNKSIAGEIKEKIPKEFTNVDVKTVHGYGYTSLNRVFSCEIDNSKYRRILSDIIKYHETGELKHLERYGFGGKAMKYCNDFAISEGEAEQIEDKMKYFSRIISLTDLGRLNLIDLNDMDKGIDQLNEVAKKHEITTLNNESYRTWLLINIGASYTYKIDFTDMVFMPIHHKVETQKYDLVYIDECFPFDTYISTGSSRVRIGCLHRWHQNKQELPVQELPKVVSFNEKTKCFELKKIKNIWSNGIKEVYEIVLNDTHTIRSTQNHKFLTEKGWVYLCDLKIGDTVFYSKTNVPYCGSISAELERLTVTKEMYLVSKEEVFDMEVEDNHNFIISSSSKDSKAKDYGIIAHNCQDLNSCQRELMKKAMKPETGRFLAVGDKKQAIYGFSGSDAHSFDTLTQQENTIKLPLSICYRCGSDIIKEAQKIMPTIEASPNAKKGLVDTNASYQNINEGDMVICRNTAPLVSLCLKLLMSHKKAFVMGSDISKDLVSMVESTKKKSKDFSIENIFAVIYKEKKELIERLSKDKKPDEDIESNQIVRSLTDKINTLEILAKGCENGEELIKKIADIFSDDKDGICLSSIHKSKGLEADKVFIIHRDLMPSKYAKQDWEIEQEKNLEYVAITRAKSYLGYVTDFDAYQDIESQDKGLEVKESDFVGTVGEFKKLILTVIYVKEFNAGFGDTFLYEMVDDEGNVFSRFGEISDSFLISNHSKIDKGSIIEFNAKIKEHKEYRGVKTNVISTIFPI